MDGNGHGTNVAGILGATGNNGTGTTGVAWNVQIMPVEFMGADGSGSVSNFIQALNYAVQHGAKITNNSWEGAPYSAALYGAFQNAQQHGVICVAAAGNEGSNDDWNPDYPASLSTNLNNVVTVAATDNRNQLASFSNFGTRSVDLAAPGVNILSTLPYNNYGAMSGTSMAAPEVAGAMALVWSLHPTWSYTQVINQVLNTTQKLPSLQGKVKTGGLLDLAAAVGYGSSTSNPTSPVVTNVTAQSSGAGAFNSLVVTFNQPINLNSVGYWDVALTNRWGQGISLWASAVGNSGNQIQLHFANQTIVGNYKLSITSNVHDTHGDAVKPYQSLITLQSAKTYSNWSASTIPVKGTMVSSITVPPGTTIGNIQLNLNVSFPYDKSLYIYLISPSGKTIALDYDRGGWRSNLSNTTFSETASRPISSGQAPFTGAFLPEQSLSQLNGSNAGGTWRLGIVNSGGCNGKLLNWSLTITPPPTVNASGNGTTASTSSTYTSSSGSSIAAKGTTVSSITVPSGATIRNIQVSLNASFPYDSDLYLYLISPSGKSIALDYDRGGSRANFTDTVFSQSANTPIAQGRAPFQGDFRPEQALSQLNGSSAGGTWRLGIVNYGPYSGRLLNWSLTITPSA
jgi:subtilisin family serine protease